MPPFDSFSRAFTRRYLGHPFRFFILGIKAIAATHLCVTYLYNWGSVSGASMLPDWEIWGDGAVSSLYYRRGRGIKVGDTVKFKVPVTSDDAIKRVAGLPGDYVLVHDPESGKEEMIQVPQGHCWVLGDNLYASRDSRLYGPLPMALIDGKVIYRTGGYPWQWHRIQKTRNPFKDAGTS